MRVELVGLPACGKSTIKENLKGEKDIIFPIDEFTSTKYKILSIIKKIHIALKMSFRNLEQSIYIYKYVRTYIKDKKNSFRFYLYFITIFNKINSKIEPNKICFYDEGIVQVLLGLILNGKEKYQIIDFEYFIDFFPEKLIFINIEFNTFIKRTDERVKNVKYRNRGIRIEENDYSYDELLEIYNIYNNVKEKLIEICKLKHIEYTILSGDDIDIDKVIEFTFGIESIEK